MGQMLSAIFFSSSSSQGPSTWHPPNGEDLIIHEAIMDDPTFQKHMELIADELEGMETDPKLQLHAKPFAKQTEMGYNLFGRPSRPVKTWLWSPLPFFWGQPNGLPT